MTENNRAVLGTHNGGSSQNYAGADNSAYQDELDFSLRKVITEGFTANHLVFRRKEDDGFGFHKSNKQPSIHQNTNGNVGQALKRDFDLRKCENTSSLSQSSEPASPTVARGYITSSHCLNKTYNCESRRRKIRQKHDCISFFEIETDRARSYKYRPGEEVTGCITIIVRRSFDLEFVQLVATGHGKVTRRVSSDGYSRAFREIYLHNVESYMNKGGGGFSSVLLPGQYTIRFCVELPSDLPSSLHHNDTSHGLSFDVSYSLKARLCGRSDSGTLWHTSAHSSHIRVLLEKQIHFLVERDFDVNAVPGAVSPIVHTEKVTRKTKSKMDNKRHRDPEATRTNSYKCDTPGPAKKTASPHVDTLHKCTRQIFLGRTHQIANTVTVTTDRGVFLAGDKIRVYLQAFLQASQSVKDIKCCLQKHVITSQKNEPMVFSFTKITIKNPAHKQLTNPSLVQNFVVEIPTQTSMISPYSLGSSQLRVDYFLSLVLRFSPGSGKLTFKIPVGIGPCAEPINAEKNLSRTTIPFFNRPIRFPFFSAQKHPTRAPTSAHPSVSSKTSSVTVTAKYSAGLLFGMCLCCIHGRK